jgi:hypothetical protein
MKQTAVEWLYEELILEGFNVPKVFYDKAKEMEKEQIMDAYYYDPNCDEIKDDGENYYNETYESKTNI